MHEDIANYHHSSISPESNNERDTGDNYKIGVSPKAFTPKAYEETYTSPIPRSKEEDSPLIDPRDLDKRTKRYHLSDPKDPSYNYKYNEEYEPETYHPYSNSHNSNLRNHKTRTIYTICETNNEAGSSIENQSSNMLRTRAS